MPLNRPAPAVCHAVEMARLWLAQEPPADEMLERDPLALLTAMLLDQQIPLEKAFVGPYRLAERLGVDHLDASAIVEHDPDDFARIFATPPAIHRFPGAMAARVRELAAVVAEEYGGDASRIWSEAPDADELRRRLEALPGFGPMKVTTIGSILAKRLGVAAAEPLVPSHHTLGDVDSPQALLDYQAAKRAHKAAMRAATP